MISIQEAQHLQQKVRSLVSQPGATNSTDLIAILSADHGRMLNEINRQISRLAGWCDEGLVLEAVSIESAWGQPCRVARELCRPADLWGAWRDLCLSVGVGEPVPVDNFALAKIDSAFAESSRMKVAVETLQRTVLGRESIIARVSAMRQLYETAPRNRAVRGLVVEFERQALDQMSVEIKQALGRKNRTLLEASFDAVRELGWKSPGMMTLMDTVRAALEEMNEQDSRTHLDALAAQMESSLARRDLWSFGPLEEEWESVIERYRRQPTEAQRLRTEPARRWAEEARNRLRVERLHGEHCEVLRQALDQNLPYSEVECHHAAVLAHDIGIPEDLGARFRTVEAAWRAHLRSKQRRWIVLATTGVVCTVAALAFGAHQLYRYTLASEEAKKIKQLLDGCQYNEARIKLDSLSESDPSLFASSQIDVCDKRCQEERLKHDEFTARKQNQLSSVEKWITSCESMAHGPLPSIGEVERWIRERLEQSKALGSVTAGTQVFEQILKPLEEQKQSLTKKLELCRVTLDRLHQNARQVLLDERRNKWSDIGEFAVQSPLQQTNREELARYRERVTNWLKGTDEVIAQLGGGQQSEALTVLRGIAQKSKEAAERRDVELEDFNPKWKALWSGSITSADSWRQEAKQIQQKYNAIIAALGENKRLDDGMKSADMAVIMDDWAQQLAALKQEVGWSPSEGFPALEVSATKVQSELGDFIKSHPDFPLAPQVRDWLACAAVLSTKGGDLAVRILSALDGMALGDLQQGDLDRGRRIFLRKGLRTDGPVDLQIRELSDLKLGMDQLKDKADLSLRNDVSDVEVVEFAVKIRTAIEHLKMESDAIEVGEILFNLIGEIAALPDSKSYPGATAAVCLQLIELLEERVLDSRGADAALVREIQRWQEQYGDLERADWPRQALEGEAHHKASKFLGELKRSDFLSKCNAWKKRHRDVCEDLKQVTFCGTLVRLSRDQRVIASPPYLAGEFWGLFCIEGRWILRPVTLLSTSPPSPTDFSEPITFLYADSPAFKNEKR